MTCESSPKPRIPIVTLRVDAHTVRL